jgi:signal transduction histidine kinase
LSTFQRIGGPSAINVWALLIPGAIWPLIAWAGPDRDVSLGAWLVVGALALVPTALVLLAARIVALPPGDRAPRPWIALVAFALAGIVHALATGVLVRVVGLDNDLTLGRIGLRVVVAVLWMSVIVVAVDEHRRHRDVMRTLRERVAVLREVEVIERERFDQLALEVRREAVAPVLGALERIRSALVVAEGAGGEREAALRLGDVITKQVRPLSHALLGTAAAWVAPAAPDETVPWERRVRRIISGAGSRPSHHPWIAALVYEVSVTPFLAVTIGAPVAVIILNAVVATLILGGGATLANRVLGARCARSGTGWGLLIGVVVSVLVVTVGNGAFVLITLAVTGTAQWYPSTVVTFPVLVLIINVAAGAASDRRAEEERLAIVSDQVEWATARITQRVRHERHILGAWLHGPTQSALLAVAARIERADNGTRAAAITAALPDLAAAIESVQVLVEGIERPAPADAAAIRNLVRMWEGVLRVDVDVSPEAELRFATDPSAYATIVDLLAEALANAVRHGGAATAAVQVELLDRPDRLRLEVVDDGGLLEDVEPGMGSRLLDAVSLRWSLVSHGDGTTALTAEVPCAPCGGAAANPLIDAEM